MSTHMCLYNIRNLYTKIQTTKHGFAELISGQSFVWQLQTWLMKETKCNLEAQLGILDMLDMLFSKHNQNQLFNEWYLVKSRNIWVYSKEQGSVREQIYLMYLLIQKLPTWSIFHAVCTIYNNLSLSLSLLSLLSLSSLSLSLLPLSVCVCACIYGLHKICF